MLHCLPYVERGCAEMNCGIHWLRQDQIAAVQQRSVLLGPMCSKWPDVSRVVAGCYGNFGRF